MAENLLLEKWSGIDSAELMILLRDRVGGPGQYDSALAPEKFFLPLARSKGQIALAYAKGVIVRIEPGAAFDASKWESISKEIESEILGGALKRGRDFSFSSRRVLGGWHGATSGVQILPAPESAPRATVEMADHPFVLEFPLRAGNYWPVIHHRRVLEHRKLTLVLNVLLRGHISYQLQRAEHLWARVGSGAIEWVQRFFWADLGETVTDHATPLPDERIPEIDPVKYYEHPGGAGNQFSVPTNLDESIALYQALDKKRREKFERAAYWLDMASRQWWLSTSSSFACLVSAIEALVEPDSSHATICEQCKETLHHHVPGQPNDSGLFLRLSLPMDP